ncbi:heme oxygenase (biliverdin-producing) [Corynebacterium doosanense]|uniref:Heme oxygenase n=1 Tax=Corynebacterium doosanense CAU 212 = DSM 45436 TaxID=558173 RepID=A0A097IF23_9CORY|nr:biliverdin-producing heme oxygenase [Corynebacterium doosanense]AIT60747.1 heme oxygenase [Corynebacterium doosanense CAU 212 = DSM 45436]
MCAPALVQPLSIRLRECPAQAHEHAEGSDFMTSLLGGDATPEAFTALTAQLYYVYDALEAAMRRHRESVWAGQIYDARLERRDAIATDLAFLLGPGWREEITPLPATRRYVERLEEADEIGVIGHHYVRYLGDVAGGQVIATMMQRLYGVSPEGLSFYDFSALGKIKPFRDDYRAALDGLDLTDAQAAALTDEAELAFALNSDVFADLAGEPAL